MFFKAFHLLNFSQNCRKDVFMVALANLAFERLFEAMIWWLFLIELPSVYIWLVNGGYLLKRIDVIWWMYRVAFVCSPDFYWIFDVIILEKPVFLLGSFMIGWFSCILRMLYFVWRFGWTSHFFKNYLFLINLVFWSIVMSLGCVVIFFHWDSLSTKR